MYTTFRGVPIRTVRYIESAMGLNVKETFLQKDVEYPLYYKHHQTSRISVVNNEDQPSNLIGIVKNIRIDKDMLVCDVNINPLNVLSINFIGVIDNFRIKHLKNVSTNKIDTKLIKLYVFDKEFKEEVDKNVREQATKE